MADRDLVTDQLLAAIRIASQRPELDWAQPPEPLTGGFWAQMWRVRLTDHQDLGGDLVARIMPEPKIAARETAVQAHLAQSGYPTPAVRLAAPPSPELGLAWMLMDHAPGQPLLANLSGPGAIIRLRRIARALPDQLARHAATLHCIDTTPLRDTLAATDLLTRVGDQAAAINRADLASVANHLQHHRPAAGPTAICHGDLHPFNILTHHSGDTVLDWSATQLANPAYDIAFTQLLLKHPPLPAPRPLQPIIAAVGRALARRFTNTYNRLAPQLVDDNQLAWFTNLHALRITTEAATWHAQDEVDQHPGHPFLALAPTLTEQLQDRTGIALTNP